MAYNLYDYLDASGDNDFRAWTAGCQPVERAKLNSRIDMLTVHGEGLFPQILTNSGVPGILKIRCHGNTQLRPLLCRGPHDADVEFTFLLGAKEKGSKWVPKDAPTIADGRKEEVLKDIKRRCRHERVG